VDDGGGVIECAPLTYAPSIYIPDSLEEAKISALPLVLVGYSTDHGHSGCVKCRGVDRTQ